jgi:hypothetical protein
MAAGKVGQCKKGQIGARNRSRTGPCVVVMRVTDNAGTTVFESGAVEIGPNRKVRLRFGHCFTPDEAGKSMWTWEVWPVECVDSTPWDNVRQRKVNVKAPKRKCNCGAVLGLCARYVGSASDVTVEVKHHDTFERVMPGDVLCVHAGPGKKLKSSTEFKVYDAAGEEIRKDKIHTSCSRPIYVGQPFGAFVVTDLELIACE